MHRSCYVQPLRSSRFLQLRFSLKMLSNKIDLEVGYSSWLLMEPPAQDRNPMRNHNHFDFLIGLVRLTIEDRTADPGGVFVLEDFVSKDDKLFKLKKS